MGWLNKNQDLLNDQFQDFDQNEQDHSIIWTTFTNREPKGSEYKKFLNGDWSEKKKAIFRYALDADDALFRSKEMMRIKARAEGDADGMSIEEINNADFLPSASGLDYSDSGIVDNSSREYASKLADASQDIFGVDIDNKEAMRWIRATNVKAPDQGHPEGTVRY
jgi:hypothetical protein